MYNFSMICFLQAIQNELNTQFADHLIDILGKVLVTHHDDASDSFGFFSVETLMLSLAKLVSSGLSS